jgi:hypothetical protein
MSRQFAKALSVALLAALWLVAAAGAEEAARVRLNTFRNAKALPFQAGLAKGIFARHGIALDLAFTESSKNQRDGLAAGRFEIAHSALDNAVAMIEVARQDVIIVTGGDSGMNEFFVQGEINSFADLRGRTLVVDAPDTAYGQEGPGAAWPQGRRRLRGQAGGRRRLPLQGHGGEPGQCRRDPQSPLHVQAEQMGMRSLGRTVDLLGPYQAGGARASMAPRSSAISRRS